MISKILNFILHKCDECPQEKSELEETQERLERALARLERLKLIAEVRARQYDTSREDFC